MIDDIFVYYVDFPVSVRAVSTVCPDGYNVYINERLSKEQKQEAYLHEVTHIKEGHLEGDINVDEVERSVHGTTNEL